MQSLSIDLTHHEKLALANQLDSLFAAQDRPLSTPKKAFLIQELANSGYPLRALSAGIRKLMNEDLRAIKLLTLLDAASEFMESAPISERCDKCNQIGVISAKDDLNRGWALSCKCRNGDRWRAQRVVTWNGEGTQYSNGRALTIS